MVLYGGLIGFGLKDFFAEKLTPLEAIFGAILFISTFVTYIKYIDQIENGMSRIKFKTIQLASSIFRKNSNN